MAGNNDKSYDALLLEPSEIRFHRGPRGGLVLRIGDQEYQEFTLRRAFPLVDAERYIGFFLPDGTELGMLENMADLADETRQQLSEELDKNYFRPIITEITHIGEDFGLVQAELETTRGPRSIEIRGIRSNIRLLAGNRALIQDVDGNRYELRQWHTLPKMTREILGL